MGCEISSLSVRVKSSGEYFSGFLDYFFHCGNNGYFELWSLSELAKEAEKSQSNLQ